MSYAGKLSVAEREEIVSSVDETVRAASDRKAHSVWADGVDLAFRSANRQLVYLDGGQPSQFYSYSPDLGCFTPFSDLEIQSLLYDCRADGHLRQTTVGGIIRALKARVGVTEAFFAPGRRCLACADGTLILDWDHATDLIRFEEHSPNHRARSYVPIPFLPKAGEAEIHAFLQQAIGDPVAIERLTEQIGLALFGEGCRYQRVFLLHGEGGNGKGVLSRLVTPLFPKGQVTSIPPKDIPPEWGRAQLQGSRLNFVGELDRITLEELTLLKALVTGEPISARNSKERGFTLESEALHVIATNTLPGLGQRSTALSRRFVVIPFTSAIPVERQDPLFAERLIEQGLSGLLGLCVENARRAGLRLKRGDTEFVTSPKMDEATAALFAPDHVDQFVNEHLVLTEDPINDRLRTEDVRSMYVAHCGAARIAPLGRPALKSRLEQLGLRTQKLNGGVMHLVGVRCRQNADCMGGEGGATALPWGP
jgi:hypothetical protein